MYDVMLLCHNNNHIKILPKHVDAVEQNVACWHSFEPPSRRVIDLSGGGGGTKRNRQRVDGSSTCLRLGASSSGGGGEGLRFRRLDAKPTHTSLCRVTGSGWAVGLL